MVMESQTTKEFASKALYTKLVSREAVVTGTFPPQIPTQSCRYVSS